MHWYWLWVAALQFAVGRKASQGSQKILFDFQMKIVACLVGE